MNSGRYLYTNAGTKKPSSSKKVKDKVSLNKI